jgi:hypothetical protein
MVGSSAAAVAHQVDPGTGDGNHGSKAADPAHDAGTARFTATLRVAQPHPGRGRKFAVRPVARYKCVAQKIANSL